jgi:hypothetical protein
MFIYSPLDCLDKGDIKSATLDPRNEDIGKRNIKMLVINGNALYLVA